MRRADFLVTWQIDRKFPAFERRNGLTISLRNPAATLTFTPEERQNAGTTLIGFRTQLKTERNPIVETASSPGCRPDICGANLPFGKITAIGSSSISAGKHL